MTTLPLRRVAELLEPYYPGASSELLAGVSTYLDLLVKWNARMNLTAIRFPEEMVTRHFGESLFVARHLPGAATLLDLGSGAGFPGLPVQLARTDLRVTVAESNKKKCAFLLEAIRVLGLRSEVWAGRVEAMPAARRFDVVTMRAVDAPLNALVFAEERLVPGGCLAILTTEQASRGSWIAIPGSEHRHLQLRCG